MITQIWKEREADNTWSWSWSRVYSTFTGASAIAAFAHVTWIHHAIPDAATLSGLAAWAIHGYAVNKAATAFGKGQNL